MTLEWLLNKLIEKGWKPFGEDCIKEVNYVKHHWTLCWYFWWWSYQRWKPIRELVSKESMLWQFVCENGMVKPQVYAWYFYREWMWKEVCKEDYEFRLIESALCDEDKLEQFLLDNIKIDG